MEKINIIGGGLAGSEASLRPVMNSISILCRAGMPALRMYSWIPAAVFLACFFVSALRHYAADGWRDAGETGKRSPDDQ